MCMSSYLCGWALSCASPAAWCCDSTLELCGSRCFTFLRLRGCPCLFLRCVAYPVGDHFVLACMLQSVLSFSLFPRASCFAKEFKSSIIGTMASLSFGCRFLVFFAFAARALALPSASAVDAKQIRNSCVESRCEHVRLPVRAISCCFRRLFLTQPMRVPAQATVNVIMREVRSQSIRFQAFFLRSLRCCC